jgi:hypothetical protein
LAVIKTATNYSDKKEDFFFYDRRLYLGHRKNFNYKLNDNSIKIFWNDYVNDDIKKYGIKNDFSISVIKDKPFVFNYDFQYKNNKIYHESNIFFPIIFRVIIFLSSNNDCSK